MEVAMNNVQGGMALGHGRLVVGLGCLGLLEVEGLQALMVVVGVGQMGEGGLDPLDLLMAGLAGAFTSCTGGGAREFAEGRGGVRIRGRNSFLSPPLVCDTPASGEAAPVACCPWVCP